MGDGQHSQPHNKQQPGLEWKMFLVLSKSYSVYWMLQLCLLVPGEGVAMVAEKGKACGELKRLTRSCVSRTWASSRDRSSSVSPTTCSECQGPSALRAPTWKAAIQERTGAKAVLPSNLAFPAPSGLWKCSNQMSTKWSTDFVTKARGDSPHD